MLLQSTPVRQTSGFFTTEKIPFYNEQKLVVWKTDQQLVN